MKRIKNLYNNFIDYMLDEWKFLLILIILFIIIVYPVNYYITIGGGISDATDRVIVTDEYKAKGSFNISFVSQLKGTVGTYLLSYVMPNWERESIDDYKYDEDDNIDDIEFRNKLDLESANSNAEYWGYTLANKDIKVKSSKIYVVYVWKEYKNKLKVQDEILSIDGNTFSNTKEYSKYINSLNEGDKVSVKVLRNNKEKNIVCTICKYKDNLILGVSLQSSTTYKTNPKVKFNFKDNESGPSGGLITTLEIYNKLTKNDITNGLKIAGTGTIEADGTIGEIGGVKYKVLGAAKKKADVFLVPKDNYKECIKTVKENNLNIKVIKVNNIKDAINKLKKLGE